MRKEKGTLFEKITASRIGIYSRRHISYDFLAGHYSDIGALASGRNSGTPETPEAEEYIEWLRKRIKTLEDSGEKTEKAVAAFEKFKKYVALKFNDNVVVQAISIFEKNYPCALRGIPSPPLVIFTAGVSFGDHERNFSVVGTRKPSDYAILQCKKICGELVENNMTLVSGLAVGIDSCVHETAIRSQARTYAVLGTGFDVPSPASNIELFDSVIRNGAVISEYPPGSEAFKSSFVYRNRIISGLSAGTLVAAAGIDSGALITANYSQSQGRKVFSLTGDIDREDFTGCHDLIKKSYAKLVLNVADIFSELGIELKNGSARRPAQIDQDERKQLFENYDFTEIEKAVYDAIDGFESGPQAGAPSIDDIAAALEGGPEISQIIATLTKLEVEGIITSLSAKRYTTKK